MQQQISRETKRDSSAMKSISLLTMVFLPATAIAVSFSYFMRLRANRILSQGSSITISCEFFKRTVLFDAGADSEALQY
jgi:hypothetical protein